MIDLPPALARHFRDLPALLRAPNVRLVELARGLTPDDRARLYYRLRTFRPGFVESVAARAAGIDPDAERRRLIRLLEIADEAELAAR